MFFLYFLFKKYGKNGQNLETEPYFFQLPPKSKNDRSWLKSCKTPITVLSQKLSRKVLEGGKNDPHGPGGVNLQVNNILCQNSIFS